MATLNLTIPTVSLNYAGAGTGPSSTRYVSDYTDQRITWFKGVDNIFDITIVGSDRRPVSLLTREVIITMWNRETGSTIFRRRVMPTAPENGQGRLVVFARDLMMLGQGLYTLAATYIDDRGFETALTWNRARVAAFDVEVKDAPIPTTRSTYEITKFSYVSENGVNLWVSSAFDGPEFYKKETSLFSMAVYVTNWTGSLIVQGTMDSAISYATLWADLKPMGSDSALISYTGQLAGATGIDPFNYYAGVRWVRVVRHTESSNAGHLDKVLIRV
jgi:hypothetical protein